MPIPSQMFNRAKAAELLGISHDTLERLIASGQLAETWVSPRSPRISAEDIEAYIAANTGQRVTSPGAA